VYRNPPSIKFPDTLIFRFRNDAVEPWAVICRHMHGGRESWSVIRRSMHRGTELEDDGWLNECIWCCWKRVQFLFSIGTAFHMLFGCGISTLAPRTCEGSYLGQLGPYEADGSHTARLPSIETSWLWFRRSLNVKKEGGVFDF
jgi:hypothetical protein